MMKIIFGELTHFAAHKPEVALNISRKLINIATLLLKLTFKM